MKSFVIACLISASSFGAELSADQIGSFSLAKGLTVDLESINEALEEGSTAPEAVADVEEDIIHLVPQDDRITSFTKDIVKQVDTGFEGVSKANDATKEAEIDVIQKERAQKLGAIFSQSNARANKLFELEQDLEMGDFEVEDISQILKDASDQIAKVNEEGDKDIESVANTHTAVDINNNAVLKDLVKDIIDNDGDDDL